MDKEKLIAEIKAMSVLELFEIVKALEEEFGVSAAATAVAVAVCRKWPGGQGFLRPRSAKPAMPARPRPSRPRGAGSGILPLTLTFWLKLTR